MKRLLALALAALSVMVFGQACSSAPVSSGSNRPKATQSPSASASPTTPEVSATPAQTRSHERDDDAELPLKRTIDVGSLKVDVKYTALRPIEEWQASISKPLLVSITAVNRDRRSQKIYLMRATAATTASNDSGPLENTEDVVDLANLSPGFIVTSPNTYNESFTIPAVDASTTTLTLDFTYELLQEVSKDKLGIRDFAKQVATDRLIIPITN